MTILEDLRELMGEDMPFEAGLKSLAEGIAVFYKTLVDEGVPEQEAAEMTSTFISAVCAR